MGASFIPHFFPGLYCVSAVLEKFTIYFFFESNYVACADCVYYKRRAFHVGFEVQVNCACVTSSLMSKGFTFFSCVLQACHV